MKLKRPNSRMKANLRSTRTLLSLRSMLSRSLLTSLTKTRRSLKSLRWKLLLKMKSKLNSMNF